MVRRLFFGVYFVSSGSALIGSSSLVFQSPSSSNYILFSLSSVLCLLAFLLLFWLGSATGRRPHTPTTTHFQHAHHCPTTLGSTEMSHSSGVPGQVLHADKNMGALLRVEKVKIDPRRRAASTALLAARTTLWWCATSSIRACAPGSFANGHPGARGAGRRNTVSRSV